MSYATVMLDAGERLTPREVGHALLACTASLVLSAILTPFISFTLGTMSYLCAFTALAWYTSPRTAVPACLVALPSLYFFFGSPAHPLLTVSMEKLTTLAMLLATVLLVSRVANRLQRQAAELTARDNAQKALQLLAERSIQMDWRESVIDDLCRAVRSCFHFTSVCIWDDTRQRLAVDGERTQASENVKAALMANQDFDLQRTGMSIRILRSGVRRIGAIQIEGALPNRTTIGAVASLVSLTMERTHALEKEVNARSESLSEQLRSSVLDGLAHSIKTPLTTIAVSAAGVVATGELTSTQVRLLHTIDDQTRRITTLTDRLLRTARIDSRMVVKRRLSNIPELVQEALSNCEEPERFLIQRPAETMTTSTDPDLLRMAVVQVAENALKYSLPDSPIEVDVSREGTDARIAIHNIGSYVPPAERALVFKRFYRAQGSEQRAPGTGLGLFVAKHAIDALAGDISLESDPEFGTTVTLQIPL